MRVVVLRRLFRVCSSRSLPKSKIKKDWLKGENETVFWGVRFHSSVWCRGTNGKLSSQFCISYVTHEKKYLQWLLNLWGKIDRWKELRASPNSLSDHCERWRLWSRLLSDAVVCVPFPVSQSQGKKRMRSEAGRAPTFSGFVSVYFDISQAGAFPWNAINAMHRK